MTAREQLVKELEQAPDFLINEVLDFLLFIKIRLTQRNSQEVEEPAQHSFLSAIDELSSSVSFEEWSELPSDLSKNLDHYLYGSPKIDE
jgi:hypothetical protein